MSRAKLQDPAPACSPLCHRGVCLSVQSCWERKSATQKDCRGVLSGPSLHQVPKGLPLPRDSSTGTDRVASVPSLYLREHTPV